MRLRLPTDDLQSDKEKAAEKQPNDNNSASENDDKRSEGKNYSSDAHHIRFLLFLSISASDKNLLTNCNLKKKKQCLKMTRNEIKV